MAERLALGIIPGIGWSAREVQTIAHRRRCGFRCDLRRRSNEYIVTDGQQCNNTFQANYRSCI